jgi:hypothetical protein
MPLHEFIDVRIQVDGQSLVEYPDPDDASNSHHNLSRYVEVRAGQAFSVKVKLLPGLQIQNAPHLYAKVEIDQDPTKDQKHWSCKDDASIVLGQLQRELKVKFSARPYKEPVTGAWYMHSFEFGALGVSK